MPRGKRVLYDGAVYHIVQRGHAEVVLFREEENYRVFKKIVREYMEKYGFYIYHYCLMPTHFHILLKICFGVDLPKIFHGINQSYSHYYAKAFDYRGSLYQNRYKNFLITHDSYLLECGRYIERNPVRGGLVVEPSEYAWSSYNFYANNIPDPLVTENPLYASFGETEEARRTAYRKYVLDERPYEKLLDKAIEGLFAGK